MLGRILMPVLARLYAVVWFVQSITYWPISGRMILTSHSTQQNVITCQITDITHRIINSAQQIVNITCRIIPSDVTFSESTWLYRKTKLQCHRYVIILQHVLRENYRRYDIRVVFNQFPGKYFRLTLVPLPNLKCCQQTTPTPHLLVPQRRKDISICGVGQIRSVHRSSSPMGKIVTTCAISVLGNGITPKPIFMFSKINSIQPLLQVLLPNIFHDA